MLAELSSRFGLRCESISKPYSPAFSISLAVVVSLGCELLFFQCQIRQGTVTVRKQIVFANRNCLGVIIYCFLIFMNSVIRNCSRHMQHCIIGAKANCFGVVFNSARMIFLMSHKPVLTSNTTRQSKLRVQWHCDTL